MTLLQDAEQDKRLRSIEGNRHKTGAEAGGNKDCPFGPIRFQRAESIGGNRAVTDISGFRKFLHDPVHRSETVSRELFQIALGHCGLICRQLFQKIKLFS